MINWKAKVSGLLKRLHGLKRNHVLITLFFILTAIWFFSLPSSLFGDVSYSTVVMSREGELLGARVSDDGQWRFPPCDSVPEKFEKALIEYEDRSFYSHFGVSLRGICRAFWQNVSNGKIVSGGSTITMQTIRLHRRGKRNVIEKLMEMFLATRLELTHSKREILEMYVSHAPFGGNVVGIDAAMWRYLGNDGNDMSWAEAATLAVLQNAPSAVHLSKNRERLLDKRNRLLKRLYEKGEINEDEFEMAIDEPLIYEPHPMPQTAPHLVERFYKTAKGEKTVTDIEFSLQKRVESIAAYRRNELSLSGINDLAIIIAEVSSGKIVAYCGNADINAEREGKWVNIAASPRSSGSILKPLLYCAAISEGLILQNTLLPDIPMDFGGFMPKNFDGSYMGVTSAAEALSLSLNVPNVWLLKEYGVSKFVTLLQKCGFSTLTGPAERYGLSIILGGAEVSLLDVVNCYTKIARFEKDFPLNDSIAVFSMFEAMREVNRPDQLDLSRVSSAIDVAWKTGTSYGARDAWAIGVTPSYVVGVWAGNADGTGVADLTGARTAGPVMFDIFNILPGGKWFMPPSGKEMDVCKDSGYPAGKYCKERVIRKVSENAVKCVVCPYCRQIPVSLDGMRRVENASEPMELRSYFILPPVQKYFYKQTHADFNEPPVHDNGKESNMKFIYPADGSVITLPCGNDGTRSELICKATHSDPAASLFWYLENNFLASTTDIHQLQLSPSPGYYKLTIFDEKGNQNSVEFIIK